MKEAVQYIPVDLISRCRFQMRTHFSNDALEELADSMRAHGVIEPVVVRPLGGEGGSARYELVCGERRWRAAQRISLEALPCIVRRYSDEEVAAVGLIENFQRENLSPIETARGIERLIDQFDLTQEAVADQLGVSHTTVCHYLRLLDLPRKVQKFLDDQQLSMGHAKAILSAPEGMREKLAASAVLYGTTVRKLEAQARKAKAGKTAPRKDADLAALENELSATLGAAVRIDHDGKRWQGEIRIRYHSEEECDGILQRLKY